jgi:hypothetical protein
MMLMDFANKLGPDITVRKLAIQVIGMKRNPALPRKQRFAVEALWWTIESLYISDYINQ